MKFSVAVAALAVGAQANYAAENVTYTTEVVTAYTTYCPAATQVTYGGKTYTVTEATTLTISDCPCTVSKPVYTTSSVICSTCTASASSASSPAPVYPTTYANGTAPTTSSVMATGGYTTSTAKASTTASTTSATSVPTAAAGKIASLSGAAVAGFVGLIAFL
ncbi:hypothetical protein SUNI508_10524 [Seiridium unicorne]|uniref:Clock-controlled protein 6 n=1 Tax=Seiridium unicorne TaxID=138068 RepID=A0ABR2ULV5_9PEZI